MSPAPDLSMFNRFMVTFRKGDIIFCEYEPGDTFYLIQSGRVQIVRIIGDLEKNIDILYPGEVFGEMAILEEAPRSATTIALDEVKALEFNRENFEVLMMGNPAIALKLLKLFIKRIYDQKRRFMILTLDDTEARVADVFLMLAENQSLDTSAVDSIDFKTTVDDMSHWAGIPVGPDPRGAQPLRGPAAHRASPRPDRREEHQRLRPVRELPPQAPGEIEKGRAARPSRSREPRWLRCRGRPPSPAGCRRSPSRFPRARCAPSPARTRGARSRGPSARSARRGGCSCPAC